LENFKDKSKGWNLTKTIGPFVGSCFTITYPRQASKLDFSFTFELLRQSNLRVHFHNPGEEFWFFLDVFPMGMPTYFLNVKDNINFSVVNIKMKSSLKESQSTITRPCSPTETTQSYTQCIKQKVIENITDGKLLNCSTVFTNFLYPWQIPLCQTEHQANEAFKVLKKALYGMLDSKCSVPCSQTVYTASINECIENKYNNDNNNLVQHQQGTLSQGNSNLQ